MNLKSIQTAAFICLVASASPALAQEHNGHDAMKQDSMMAQKGDQGPSSKAFVEANTKMHKDMDIEFTGNADKDFVRGMIAHHQGAIDMAKVELEYGKDAEIRKLAETIIAAQESEIKDMKAWLEKNGG
ncbi:CopM family metallochaperone [Phyllobacterium sp. K27]